MNEFSHYSDDGLAKMVDISSKGVTTRIAKAKGFVRMREKTLELIDKNLIPKGNVFEVARVAGIMSAKNTDMLIPMCHSLLLSYVDIKIEIDKERGGVTIESEIKLEGKTGAEMEALTSVSIAALTIYDMCRAVDKTIILEDIKLIEKRGGKSDIVL